MGFYITDGFVKIECSGNIFLIRLAGGVFAGIFCLLVGKYYNFYYLFSIQSFIYAVFEALNVEDLCLVLMKVRGVLFIVGLLYTFCISVDRLRIEELI